MIKFEKINNAVIDLGSNSIRMLIFRRNKEGKLFQVVRSLRYTNLVKDVTSTGELSENSIKRNIEAFREFQKIAQDYDVHHVYIYATSAMREAKNSQVLINEVKECFGLDVHIISGETEAEYGFYGVSQCFTGPILIFDIGGGSTELIYGDKEIKNKVSLELGCVRSTENFLKDQNHITQEEIKRLENYSFKLINNSLKSFDLPSEFRLVGIGGTITTLASIVKELPIYDSDKIHKTIISYDQIRNCLNKFISTNIEERKKIVGLPDKRVEYITAGTVIALTILKAARKTSCTICDFDNLEGAAYLKFMLENPKSWDNQTYL